jgi:hypothetical protein
MATELEGEGESQWVECEGGSNQGARYAVRRYFFCLNLMGVSLLAGMNKTLAGLQATRLAAVCTMPDVGGWKLH